jgi:UDP-glucose 4-epimerase
MAEKTVSGRSRTRAARAVAVTGTAGFFGRNLLPRLAGDPQYRVVLALDLEEPLLRHEKVIHCPVDLTDPSADRRIAETLAEHDVDTLVHLAFLTEPSHRHAWAHELEAIGTLHVLNACAEHGVRKVVMRSTTACYGPHPQNPNFLTEGHALRGLPGSRFIEDKVEAERQLARYKRENPGCVVTSLRFAPVLGPTVRNWVTRYLSLPAPLTLLGYDPLVQFLHETDCIDALTLAVDRDFDGAYNVVGDGVLPLSAVLDLCGRIPLPVPGPIARVWTGVLWMGQILSLPPAFLAFLQYLCVADGRRAREEMGFVARYATREAVLSFAGNRRLREAPAGGLA